MELTTVDNIYAELKDRIVKNHSAPGEIISENSLAAAFGVSRTPVREALKTLQNERWVVPIPKVGIQVSNIEVAELRNNFEVRKALETLVVQTLTRNGIAEEDLNRLEALAVQCNSVNPTSTEAIELDVKFHETMWALAGNSVLFRHLKDLIYSEQRWWYYMKKLSPNLQEVGDIGSLLQLAECLRQGDLDKTLKIMYHHLEYYIFQIKNTFF